MSTEFTPLVQHDKADPINNGLGARGGGRSGKEGNATKKVLYFVFLVLYTTSTVLSRDMNAFYFSDLVEDSFEFNEEVVDPEQFDGSGALLLYGWLREVAVPKLYAEPTFAVDPEFEPVNVFDDANVLVRRTLRLRQLRVQADDCQFKFSDSSSQDALVCYPSFSARAVEKEPHVFNVAEPPIEFTSGGDSKSSGLSGTIARYPGGGHIVDLGETQDEALANLDSLFEGNLDEEAGFGEPKYVDGATRAIIVEFSLYNVNNNDLCLAEFLFEFAATSSFLTSHRVRTAQMFIYSQAGGTLLLVLEMFVIAFVLFFTFEEIVEMVTLGWAYFDSFWNFVDLINLMIFACIIGIRSHQVVLNDSFDPLTDDITLELVHLVDAENYLMSVNILICWIKSLKFIGRVPEIKVMVDTLVGAASGSVSFTLVLFIFLFGSSLAFMTAFGRVAGGFQTLDVSILTLFRYTVGDFDFDEITDASPFLGPLYAGLYLLIVFLMMVNVFIAIVSNSFEAASNELDEPPNIFKRLGRFVSSLAHRQK